MKKAFFAIILSCFFITARAQNKFAIENSRLTFFSDGAIEDIRAENDKVTGILDGSKGEIAFLVRIRDFRFPKKLMQVHFNEKFMESEKYPKSTFFGTVVGLNREKTGPQSVVAVGRLFIHGVSRDVKIPGTMEVRGKNILLKSKFNIRLGDYNISVPQVVWQNIAEDVEVELDIQFTPL